MKFGFCQSKPFRLPSTAVGWLLAIVVVHELGTFTANAKPGCGAFLDSLHREYEAGDPNFLVKDVEAQNCTPEEKQDAYYHLALGNLILEQPKIGVLYLRAALDHSGPFREICWFELWRTAQRTKDNELATEAMMGLYREFPNSKYLVEMLGSAAQVPTARKKTVPSARKPWTLGTQHLLSSNHEPGYARDYMDHRIQGAWSLAIGDHRFSPGFQSSLVHDFNLDSGLPVTKRMELATWSGELSMGYLYRWVFGSISSGTRYDFQRHDYGDSSSQGLASSFVGWNYPQLGASLGARIPVSASIQWFVFASGNRFNSQFSSTSLNNSVSMDKGDLSHQVSMALERMFLDLPGLDTVLELQTVPGWYQSERREMIGLWADEFSYALEYRRPAWQGQWMATFREERRILKSGADSVLANLKGDPVNTFYIAGDYPATERQASLGVDFKWFISSMFHLKYGLRTGYLWISSPDPDKSDPGILFQTSIRLLTRF